MKERLKLDMPYPENPQLQDSFGDLFFLLPVDDQTRESYSLIMTFMKNSSYSNEQHLYLYFKELDPSMRITFLALIMPYVSLGHGRTINTYEVDGISELVKNCKSFTETQKRALRKGCQLLNANPVLSPDMRIPAYTKLIDKVGSYSPPFLAPQDQEAHLEQFLQQAIV